MYSRMMDLEQNIEEAVRACGLKEMLRDEEAHIRAQRTTKRRIRLIGWSSASLVSIAALALLLLALPTIHRMQSYADAYAMSIKEVGSSRGEARLEGNELMLQMAAEAMANGEWNTAAEYAEQVMMALDGQIASEDEQELYEQAEWYYALTLMHNGQYIKAQRLLKSIEQRNGVYAPMSEKVRKNK